VSTRAATIQQVTGRLWRPLPARLARAREASAMHPQYRHARDSDAPRQGINPHGDGIDDVECIVRGWSLSNLREGGRWTRVDRPA